MRIILIGQAAFAEKSLEKLLGNGHDIAAVYCPLDPPGGKFDPVKTRALAHGIAVRQHKSLKAPEVREEFIALNADLAVLAFVTQIVPPQVFSVPKLGSICFHPSLLPKYRGASAINWALIKGESITGLLVTIAHAAILQRWTRRELTDHLGPISRSVDGDASDQQWLSFRLHDSLVIDTVNAATIVAVHIEDDSQDKGGASGQRKAERFYLAARRDDCRRARH